MSITSCALALSLAVLSVLAPLPSQGQGQVKPKQGAGPADPDKSKKPPLFDGNGRVIGAADGGGAGGKFGGRRGGRKRLQGRVRGLAKAIADGLEWLRRHQDEDGGFDAARFMRHDKTGEKSTGPGEGIGRVGITGFCLLPFLGDGSSLAFGPFHEVIRKGVEFLRTRQAKSGSYSKELLEHAVATYAICEAAGLSRSTVLMEEAAQALDYLASHQNADGGFSYRGKGKPSDAFTTLHCVSAYKSGVDFRLTGDRSPLQAADRWLDGAEDTMATPPPIAQGARAKESVLAAKLFGGFFLGRDPRKHAEMKKLADAILEHPPTNEKRAADPVFYYLATLGLYQMGPPYWDRWARPIGTMLRGSQRDDGNSAGSWDPMGPGAVLGGRLFVTALSVLTAESYYRYTRLVR